MISGPVCRQHSTTNLRRDRQSDLIFSFKADDYAVIQPSGDSKTFVIDFEAPNCTYRRRDKDQWPMYIDLGGGGRERKKTGLLSKDGQNTFQGPWFEPVGSSDAKFCVPDDTNHENFVLISLRKVDVVLQ